MGKIDTDEIVDIFKEEVTKKEKKDIKKKARKEKRLEKKENQEFLKLAKKKKKDNDEVVIKEKLPKEPKKKDNSINLFSFLGDTLFGFFLIVLLLCTACYGVFSLKDSLSKKIIINVVLLSIFSVFYILSLVIKNQFFKKLFAIIASMAISIFMAYQLYLA